MKRREVLDAQCAKMRAKQQGIIAKPPGSADSISEKKYKLKAAAEFFGVSSWTARRMFQDEHGILYTGKDPNSKRRAFVIPESVLMRVYRKRAA